VVLPAIEYDSSNTTNNLGLDQIDSKKVWMQCYVSPVMSEEGQVQFVVNTYMDLTGITKAQQERERILNLSPDMISVSDMNAGLVYTNPAWQQVLGYSEEELKGTFLKDFVHPDDLVRVQKKREEVVEGEAVHDFEVRCLTKEGAVRDIALSCISVPEESLIYCVGRDITERKKMEQESRENRDALARLDRTSSMGQLTGSIAHELNQPLTGILSNAQAAEMMIAADKCDCKELLETLADIVADTKRAGSVMRSLRDIYREQKGEFTSIEVSLLIEEAVELMHGEFVMQDIHLNVRNAPSEIRVDGNRVQLQQVLVNIMLNGAQAMQNLERGTRSLEVGVSRERDGVRVWVDDNGHGIDADKIGNIFEPLATWKPGGTGMGLAISDSIIRSHGGKMLVETRAEGGARVGFFLPVSVV
jgi:PAS domain S-box-containing protein